MHQVGAEVNGTLDVTRLAGWMAETNANTVSFLLWDVDGHQYLDMVRFLDWQTKNGNKLEVGASHSLATTAVRCQTPFR